MKSKSCNLMASVFALIFITLLQPLNVRAAEVNRGIGGTGHSAIENGVAGTGKSTSKEGIGGTGRVDSGIGGTGIMANKSGIGGTGRSEGDGGIGGTGIVGIITGFGSIWVNGLEIQYDAKTQVAANAGAASTNELAIGQVVVVEAKGSANELQANKISMVNAVAGQITALDLANGKMTVLGQSVIVTAHTITHDLQNQLNMITFNLGDYVQVSGLRMENGEIVASRIERTEPIAEPSLVGPITAINGNMIEIYGLQISVATITGLSVGQEVNAVGSLSSGILTAREIAPSPSMQLYGRTEQVNLQGYVGAGTEPGQIKIGNLEIVVSDPALISKKLTPGELVQISGRFASDHRVIADRIEFSRDMPDRGQYDHAGSQEHGGVDRVEHSSEHIDRPDRNDLVDHPDRTDHEDHSGGHEHSEHSH